MRVVITRADNEAAKMTDIFAEAGLTPLVAPMMEIEIIETPIDLADFQGVITTSANAVRSLAQSTETRDIPVYCIGGQSDKLAIELGFTNTLYSIGNHKNLTIFIGRNADPKAGALLYLHGDNVQGSPVKDLRQKGYNTLGRLSYRSAATKTLPDDIVAAFESDTPPEVVTFFSIRTYRLFKELVVSHGLVSKLAGTHAVCLSPAIADFVRDMRWKTVSNAAEMSANSMLEATESLKSDA